MWKSFSFPHFFNILWVNCTEFVSCETIKFVEKNSFPQIYNTNEF